MKNIKNKLKKKIKWNVGIIAIFTLVFVAVLSVYAHNRIKAANGNNTTTYQLQNSAGSKANEGSEIEMRLATDTFTFLGLDTGESVVNWESTNTNILEIASGGGTSRSASMRAVGTGPVAINITVRQADGTEVIVTFTVRVVFSINDYLSGVDGVKMEKIYATDERKALIMNFGSKVSVGTSATDNGGSSKLNLVFGNAQQAEWTSSNVDVVKYDIGNHEMVATGAGTATLSVSYTIGTETYTDTMKVYVRPQISDENGNVLAGATGSPNTVEVQNKDKVGISVIDDAHPEIAIGDKITWVISKGEGESAVLVNSSASGDRASIGSDPDAKLVYITSEKKYRIDAKAGIYNVQFYVKGTYTNFEASKTNPSNCPTVNLTTKVKCSFEDKNETIGLGGSYNLSEAFNIPLEVLRSKFTVSYVGTANTYVSKDDDKMIVTGMQLGTATVMVKLNSGVPTSDIPGFPDDTDTVYINLVIAETFKLNIAETTVAVGSQFNLRGIIGSNASAEYSQFSWSVSDGNYVSLDKTDGQEVTVTANRVTPTNTPARVTLAWTDNKGVTWVAYCSITVITSPTSMTITPSVLNMEVNSSEYIQIDGLSGTQNIDWLTSDSSIVTVTAQQGNVAAKVTSTAKTGSVVITAYNRDNGTTATCKITVMAYMDSLTIDKGDSYTAKLSDEFVEMKALYTPSNASETGVTWTSSNESVATVDRYGKVTLLKGGTTNIIVKPSGYNPNVAPFYCFLTVKPDYVNKISADVTELNLVKGTSQQINITFDPEYATDKTLTWTSSDESIAKVDENGNVTAMGVGTTYINVVTTYTDPDATEAEIKNRVTTLTIPVHVRNQLISVAFDAETYELGVGDTRSLLDSIIFDPVEDVNKNVMFTSSDTSIATVDAEGNITGVKEGEVWITGFAEDLPLNPIFCKFYVTKAATGFVIEPTSQTVKVGSSFTIKASFEPEDATARPITYSSSDEATATVNENGKVTGVKVGNCVITATTTLADGEVVTKSCMVTVIEQIKFRLSPSSREIAVGKSFSIKKVTVPANADKTATWKSSNKAIATVSSSGKVTGKKIGSCTITATLKKYKQSATCRVKVAKLRSTLKLNKKSIRINVGQTYRLKKTVWTNSSKNPSVKFTSKNKKIATVGKSSGNIKGKRVGSTVIVAKTVDGVHATAKCRVTVIRRVTSISLNKTYGICYIGRTLKLKAKVKPKKASIKKLKWSSSDPKIARVTGSGKVTGIAEGEVYITAQATDGSNKKARCYVKVMEEVPVTSIMVAQSNMTMKRGDTANLSYTLIPKKNSDSIKFASDNKRVVKVNSKGKVTAVGTGNATVTITSSSGVTATVTINVVSLNKSSLRMRQYDTETLQVIGTSDTITWYSGNNRIATVSNGKVIGKGTGTTYIYAYVNGCKMACRVQIVSVNTHKR